MKNPQQESHFEFETQLSSSERNSLRIRPAAANLSAAQKKFNLLLEQIAAARAELAVWTSESQRLRERHLLEVIALAKPVQEQQFALALAVEALLFSVPAGLKMTVRRKRALTQYILHLVRTLLQTDPDNAELHALHDRHSDDSLASIRDEEREIDLEIAEDMLSNLYGEEMVDREGAVDFEDLIQRTHERVERNEQEQSPPRKRNKREQASDARRKADSDALTQSLRDIYRKLASSLHPDRESDPTLREAKTALMQRINIAYQNRDLLALLTLQMEVEHISAASLGAVPDARLAQYNQILREQLDTLKAQQTGVIGALVDAFDIQPSRRAPVVADFDRVINQTKKQLRHVQHHLESSIAQLNDPARRATGVDQIVSMIAEQEKLDRWHEREDAKMARFFNF